MGTEGFAQAWRTFGYGVFGLVLLWIGAWVTSYLGADAGLPDAAYGVEEITEENFTLPDDPVLKIHVWMRRQRYGRGDS